MGSSDKAEGDEARFKETVKRLLNTPPQPKKKPDLPEGTAKGQTKRSVSKPSTR